MDQSDQPVALTLRCACYSRDHTVFFDYDPEDGDLYLTFHLTTHKGFFKRLWHGIRYAFGYQSRFGAWDELVIRVEDCSKIRALLEKRENTNSKFVQGVLDEMDKK